MSIADGRHEQKTSEGTFTGTENDWPLNYAVDQAPDIQKRLRRLWWKRSLERAPVIAGNALSMGLLGGAALMAFRRKWIRAGIYLLGYFYQIGLREMSRQDPNGHRPGQKDLREVELEHYALQLQRGDYGKLEVIPFR